MAELTGGISLRLEADSLKKALSKLNTTLKKRQYLHLVGLDVKAWIQKNFDNAGTENKWVRMSASTLRQRGAGAKLLQDDGDLRKSFAFKTNQNGAFVDVFSKDTKADWHHKGTSDKHIPKRPLQPSEEEGGKLMAKTLDVYLRKILKDFS